MDEQSDEEEGLVPSVKPPSADKQVTTTSAMTAAARRSVKHKRKQVQRFSEEETKALISWLDEGDNFDAFYNATRRTKSTEELSLYLMQELGTERSGMTLRNKLMDMRAKFLSLAKEERDKGYSLKTCEEYFPGYTEFKGIMERRDNFAPSELEPARSSDDEDEEEVEKPSFETTVATVSRSNRKRRLPPPAPREDDEVLRQREAYIIQRERHEMEKARHELEIRRQELEIERLEREAEVHKMRLEAEKVRLEEESSNRSLRDELLKSLTGSPDDHIKLGLLKALK